jgi:reactive intermediate/imine deaminase
MKRSAMAIAVLLFPLIQLPARAGQPPPVSYLNASGILPKGLPFSEAVRVGDLIFLSGQVGIVPGQLTLVPGGIREESQQTMENIRTVLQANGASMDDVVKCTVMLADMSEWGAFNEIYKTYFPKQFPARSAFGTSGLALGARVEVECIAVARK